MSGVSDKKPDSIDVFRFFDAVARQDAERLRAFSTIVWANTNEVFTVDEYVRANCEYLGK